MKPKEYLSHLNSKIYETKDGAIQAHYRAMWEGANEMYKLCRERQNAYREQHRDELRTYNTRYQRERRARLKAMKEDIDKISTMD